MRQAVASLRDSSAVALDLAALGPGARGTLICLACLGISILPVQPLTAQTRISLGADAFVRSASVWRGQTRSGGWVLQPDAYAAVSGPRAALAAAWWSSIEIQNLDAGGGDSGMGTRWFGQTDLSLEGSLNAGPFLLRAGAVRYLFSDGAFGQTADAVDTTEIYAEAWTNVGAFVPRVGIWHDVDRIRGSYVETGLDLRVPVLPSRHPIVGLYLVSLAGWSLGQETDRAKPEEPAYFSASGLTHVDLGLDVRVGGELRYLSTEIHVVFRPDSGARGSANSGEAWWLGVGASDAWILGVF